MTNDVNNLRIKAAYSAPKIAIYGEFANLTAGGTGSRLEGNTSSSMKQMA